MSEWVSVEREKPPDGVLVDTLSPGGIQQYLVRYGRLWMYPDMRMYVYYEPMFWKRPEAGDGKQGVKA